MKIKQPVQTEHQIQQAVIEWLQYKKWFVWRHNSGMVRTVHNTMVRMGVAGMPDVFALKDGQLLGIEVKRPGKKPTDIQQRMMDDLTKYGAQCMVVTSTEDLEVKLKALDRQNRPYDAYEK